MNGDDLRAAADRATELLDQATPGRWEVEPRLDGDELQLVWLADVRHLMNLKDPDAALIAAAPDLLATLAPAARQLADAQDEVQRLRTVLDGLLDSIGDPRQLHRCQRGVPESYKRYLRRIADAAAAARGEGA